MTEIVPFLFAAGLLLLSGSFSGSETALFSLDQAGRERAGARVRELLAAPRELLVTVLLGNLVVNLAFFTTVPLLFPGAGTGGAVLSGFGALLAVLLMGEIVPKMVALRSPILVARVMAGPLAIVVRVAAPARRVITALLEVLRRLIGESEREERRLTPEHLAAALEKSSDEGVLAAGEADLLAEIIGLSNLRVREIMTPRVDVVTLDLLDGPEGRAEALAETRRRQLTWIPVVRGEVDTVVGRVEVRDLYCRSDTPLEQLVMPVTFVPEVALVLTMLATLRGERVASAVVVDEWGGTAGVVTLEDLFEELVGDLRVEGEEPVKPVIPLGEGRFRVSGALSVRDWNELLDTEVVPNAFETVGGYVTALLGRLPRPGDRVAIGGGLVGKVHEVRGRRVETLDLWLEEAR